AVAVAGVYFAVVRGMLAGRSFTFTYLQQNYLADTSLAGITTHVLTNSSALLKFADLSPDGLWHLPDLEILARWHWLIFGFAVAFGAFCLWRVGGAARRAVFYAAAPLFIVVGLSILRLYPYGGVRQDIFLTPSLYVLAAAGIMDSVRRARWSSLAVL